MQAEVWLGRCRTARAISLLCLARAFVAFVPLRLWRGSLGLAADSGNDRPDEVIARDAVRLARQVERAAWRLPFEVKCLPQAMALSWILRRRALPHRVVIAIRPPELRNAQDGLHAWVEAGGETVIGELPGPWHAVYRAPDLSTVQTDS